MELDQTKNSDLTAEELALLTNMAETTVPALAQQEGFRLDPPNTLDEDKSS